MARVVMETRLDPSGQIESIAGDIFYEVFGSGPAVTLGLRQSRVSGFGTLEDARLAADRYTRSFCDG